MQIFDSRCRIWVVSLALVSCAPLARANAFVRGAYYRLGEDDPGAVAGNIGNDPTRDSFSDALHLPRLYNNVGYSSDVPARGPFGSKLSMVFNGGFIPGEGVGHPFSPGFYGRDTSLPTDNQGFALEAWVNFGGIVSMYPDQEPPLHSSVVYNGSINPSAPPTGFGFYLSGKQYVVRIGAASGAVERPLGPADVHEWHHLAYVHTPGTSSYFYDGKLVSSSDTDPIPAPPVGGFWVGAGFAGKIDEVRYMTFNPLAAGSFNPTDFLISDVPEPAAAPIFAVASLLAMRRRSL